MTKKRAQRFPKEFKKQKLIAFDWLFATILLISLVFHIAFVLFFKARLPDSIQQGTISQIQQQYANLILDRDLAPDDIVRTLAPIPLDRTDLLIADSREGGTSGGTGIGAETGTGISTPATGLAGTGGIGGTESQLPTAGEMAEAVRGGFGAGRNRGFGEIADEVGSVGFLGILGSGSGLFQQDYITGITDYGDIENEKLGTVLASLDAVRVSRGPRGKGWGDGGSSGPSGNDPIRGRKSRGERRETRALDADQLIGTLQPTGDVNFNDVQRHSEGYQSLDPGSRREGTQQGRSLADVQQRARRSAEYVQEIINSHRPAIIDCYKQLLKLDPNLKGEVEFRFAINPDGRVTWAEIVKTTIGDVNFQRCMMSRIGRWNDFGYGDPSKPDEVYRQTFTFGY